VSRTVELSPLAIDDLITLHRWIATEADQATADAYLIRIEARIATLAEFSNRGAPREDLAPNLRTLIFERRYLIVYRVTDTLVTVLRVISGQRELAPLLD
jgi:toxin ParE1/3/4